MSQGNSNPTQRAAHLNELRGLDSGIHRAVSVHDLRSTYDRLETLGELYPNDQEMQDAISSVRSLMVAHGKRLMENQGVTNSPSSPLSSVPASSLPTQAMPSASHSYQPPPAFPPPQSSFPPPPQSSQSAPVPPQNQPPQRPPVKPFNWVRAAIVGGVIGLLVAAAAIYTVHEARKKSETPATSGSAVAVKTNPAGASIRVNGEVKCTSDCNLDLAAGSYEIQAFLPGYEPATQALTVLAGQPAAVDLTLNPLPLSIRLFTDLSNGKVTLDGQPYADLVDGQLILDKIAPGAHTLKIANSATETNFAFDVQTGRMPTLTGPVSARNILAILVANAGSQAKLYASVPALKVALDGVPAGEAGPAGIDLNNLTAGDRELTVTDGSNERKLLVSVSPQPTLTAYLKLDINAGSLLISTAGQDGVSIFFNNRDTKVKSRQGQARLIGVPVGNHTIKVTKDGFIADPPQQSVAIAKGQEARLEFKFKSIPQFSSLRIRGAAPGIQVFLDGNPLGAVGANGGFEADQIAPGEHTVELRRDKYATKRIPSQFRTGETVELLGAEVALAAAGATLRVSLNPSSAQLSIKGPGDANPAPVSSTNLQLSEGSYTLYAKAPNHADKTVTVQLNSGDSRTLEIILTPQQAQQKQAPARRPGTMADWDQPGEWLPSGSWLTHKGGNNVTYGITPTQGTFSFQIWRKDGRRLQWFVNQTDARNYVLFQLERKNFIRKEVVNGRDRNERKTNHPLPEIDNYSIQIDITPESVVTRAYNGTDWVQIDSYSSPGPDLTQGKFGLHIPGGDTFGLNNFRFIPK